MAGTVQMIRLLFVLGLVALASVAAANGQVAEQDIEIPQITEVRDCMFSEIRGTKAYIPFEIKAFYGKTGSHGLTAEHDGVSNPILTSTPQVSIFRTNFTNSYTIKLQIDYENVQSRAVYFEYWSEGAPTHTEIINYRGNSFCRTFFVSTNIAPQIPTVEEIGDNVIDKLINRITDSINNNTVAMNMAIASLSILFLIGIAVTVLQFIAYISRRRADRKRVQLLNDTVKLATKSAQNSANVVKESEKKVDELVQAVTTRMNTDFSTLKVEMNMLLVDIKRALTQLGVSKKIVVDYTAQKPKTEQPTEPADKQKSFFTSLKDAVEKVEPKELSKRLEKKIRKLRREEDRNNAKKSDSDIDSGGVSGEETSRPFESLTIHELKKYYGKKSDDEIDGIYIQLRDKIDRTKHETDILNVVYELLQERYEERSRK